MYTSHTFIINKPAEAIAERFADLTQLSDYVNRIPEEERQKIGDITFDKDAIHLNANMLGQVSFNVVERTPSLIKMQAAGTPVPMSLNILLDGKGESTEAKCAIDIDIPPMLRPMVGSQLQKAADTMADVMANALA